MSAAPSAADGGRLRRLLVEIGRFLAVGGLATAVSFVLFNGLVHGFGGPGPFAERPITGYVLANTVGMIVSYHGARYWAFRDRPTRHADGGRTAFVVVNVVTMTLPVLCLLISRNVLGLDDPISDNIAANGIGLVLGVGSRFWIFRTFVFRRPIALTDIYPTEERVEEWAEERGDFADSGVSEGPTGRSTTDPGS